MFECLALADQTPLRFGPPERTRLTEALVQQRPNERRLAQFGS
jgi:hypothetical protein